MNVRCSSLSGGDDAMKRREESKRPGKKHSKARWVGTVTTTSTAPPPHTFSGSAEDIARTMASRRVSPKGPTSGVRMIQFFINRAGRTLSPVRRRELERAKRLLQQKIARQKTRTSSPRR